MKAAFFYLVCIFMLNVFKSQAQVHVPVYRELIIELPLLSPEKDLNTVVMSLVALGGIHYEGYCNHMKCLLLKADENIHPGNDLIMNNLKENVPSFFIKTNGKIHQVVENCNDPVIQNTETINNIPDPR